jgi:hypothetical protein
MKTVICGLLGCNAVEQGESPTFRRYISLPSSGSKRKQTQFALACAGNLLALLLYAEEGDDTFIQSVCGILPNYMALLPRISLFWFVQGLF